MRTLSSVGEARGLAYLAASLLLSTSRRSFERRRGAKVVSPDAAPVLFQHGLSSKRVALTLSPAFSQDTRSNADGIITERFWGILCEFKCESMLLLLFSQPGISYCKRKNSYVK